MPGRHTKTHKRLNKTCVEALPLDCDRTSSARSPSAAAGSTWSRVGAE
jgi:hypothetical protein